MLQPENVRFTVTLSNIKPSGDISYEIVCVGVCERKGVKPRYLCTLHSGAHLSILGGTKLLTVTTDT